MKSTKPLSDIDKATYEWQMWVPDFGEAGQEKLKNSSVLISRVGGVGSVVAYELAAAGVGKLVLAHGGNTKYSDLNRQLVMTYDNLGKSRIESAERRLKELNPHLEIETLAENVSDANIKSLVDRADLIVDCAPLFSERFAMNAEAVRQEKPIIECAMYELETQITTIVPGKTPCLACLYPQEPSAWKREFPVFGAVSGMVACMGAMEAIKVLSGLGQPLLGKLITCDLRDMTLRKISIPRRNECPVCGHL